MESLRVAITAIRHSGRPWRRLVLPTGAIGLLGQPWWCTPVGSVVLPASAVPASSPPRNDQALSTLRRNSCWTGEGWRDGVMSDFDLGMRCCLCYCLLRLAFCFSRVYCHLPLPLPSQASFGYMSDKFKYRRRPHSTASSTSLPTPIIHTQALVLQPKSPCRPPPPLLGTNAILPTL